MSTFDPKKPFTTKDGRPAKLLYAFSDGRIAAVVTNPDGHEWLALAQPWNVDETFVNTPEVKE
jgi:hypothetical protein